MVALGFLLNAILYALVLAGIRSGTKLAEELLGDAGLLWPIYGTLIALQVLVALLLLRRHPTGWVLAMLSLVTQNSIFGWYLPHGIPMWLGLLALFAIYMIVSAPFRAVRGGGQNGSGYHPGWRALHTIIWIGFVGLLFWVAYTFFPGVHELVDQLMWAANLTVSTISDTIA